jgi:hypothetical protein
MTDNRFDIVTVAQLRAVLHGRRGDQLLRTVGIVVQRIDPYGVCAHCGKKLEDRYNCCTTCADERGP